MLQSTASSCHVAETSRIQIFSHDSPSQRLHQWLLRPRDRDQLRPYPRISCDPTHARDQLRPYPQEFYGRVNVFYIYQGSAVTLPDFSVKNPTGFCTVSRLFRFKYNIPFIKFSPPPLATHALRPYLTTFLLSNSSPPWQPMLSMIQVQVQHSFYQMFPPPLATHIKIPPPPLGNPCFATLPDNIPFIKFSPPWQPMLSMIQVQVQHSFYQISPPPWQPMLCDPT